MDANPKNQVVERLRDAQNILVTVSDNPSVDQLSAAIGFTLMMNKVGKHATAVFSGRIPSTIEFLKPEATLEQNTDSLRDFIIALDKSKADKLRYKVEENVVKIFITPYKTSLGEKDLEFSQGDYNVDVVVALGVDQREHIDRAIANHGRILHDATVIGAMAGPNAVDLGNINWQDTAASSLCEMLVSISEAFQSNILDAQMSTAFLTGIVAETERFSNKRTSPKVMTIAAQLMANGANQQLISSKLQIIPDQPKPLAPQELPKPESKGESVEGELDLHDQHQEPPAPKRQEPTNGNEINIDEQGTFRSAEEEKSDIHDVKVSGSGDQKESEKPEYSQYVNEPPKTGGTLTANAKPNEIEPSVDPLSQSTEGEEKHLGPDAPEDSSLKDIEDKVKKYEETATLGSENKPTPDLDAARAAVDNASKDFDPERPKPVEGLGAQPLSDTEAKPNLDDKKAPPAVPPPIPLPLPQQQTDQDHNKKAT
jgi:hypothetical protein